MFERKTKIKITINTFFIVYLFCIPKIQKYFILSKGKLSGIKLSWDISAFILKKNNFNCF